MKCPKCQFENPPDAQFCNDCGSKLELICPECGKVNPTGSKFCSECGGNLRERKPGPQVDFAKPKSYTPKFLAEKILTHRRSIEGERKIVTVLFADVAGFASMSEQLDPEDVHRIMDGCCRILVDEIHRFEGTVGEFRGDGVMALFGAPIAHEDHAQRACHAALAIQQALVPYGEEVQRKYGREFKMRIGLNSGMVVVGAIGDDLRMDYTAMGDTTNLAARMESSAQPGTILVSKHTYWLSRDFFQFDFLGPLAVKGKEEPVKAYRLVKAGEVETRIQAAARRGFTRFVGRKRELQILAEVFELARSVHGQVVSVVGEAGVGKSRTLHEFRNLLPQGRYTYLEGRCLHYGSSMPFLPILDAFRSFVGIKEDDAESLIKSKMEEKILGLDDDLRRIIPPFQDLLSLKVDDEAYLKLEPKQKRERIFEGVRDLLVRGSQNAPIVLAIEDLHWIDKTTEELVAYLIESIPSTCIMLILLYRPEYNHSWGNKSYYTKVNLDQLPASASAELVQAILEGGAVEPRLRDLVINRSSGNPLFMEELTHNLLENGSIQKKEEQFILRSAVGELEVPDTIEGIIAARMDRLEENLKRLLQVASVIGREFFFRILQSITGMREELKPHILTLQGLEFIYEKKIFPELEYIFKHALTQEVAYKSLLLKRRKEIHESIGKAMEELFPDRLGEFYEILAYHFSKGENNQKAYQYLKLSGIKSARNNSLWEALRFYEKAITFLKKEPETDENKRKNMKVILLMVAPLRMLGYPEASLKIIEEGAVLARELNDAKALANVLGSIGLYYSSKVDTWRGIEYLERSFEQATKHGGIEVMAPIGWDLTLGYFHRRDWPKIVDITSSVFTMIKQTGKEAEFFGRTSNPYAFLLAVCGAGLGFQGNFTEGGRLIDIAVPFAHATNHIYTIAVVEATYGFYLQFTGDGELIAKQMKRSIRYWEEAGAPLYLGQFYWILAYGEYLIGDFGSALEHIEKGLKIQRDVGSVFWLPSHYLYSGMAHFGLSDLKKAKLDIEAALNLSQEGGEKEYEGLSSIMMGRILGKSAKSHAGEAEQWIRQGIKILEEAQGKPYSALGYLHLGELYAHTDKRNDAVKTLKKAEAMFQEMSMDYWLGKAQEALAKL